MTVVNDFIELAKLYPDVLNHETLYKIFSFLLYAPRFKNDILLAQTSSWPASDPPLFLPQSVEILLSHLCNIDQESTGRLWLYLKDAVWVYAEKAKDLDERFKLYGKDLGFCESRHHLQFRLILMSCHSVFVSPCHILHRQPV